MAVPKQKPREPNPNKNSKTTSSRGDLPSSIDEIEDEELRAEMKALEQASIEDLMKWEQNLSDE